MFIIEQNGQKYIWNNELADDFLRFFPEHFGCDPSEVSAYYVPKVKKLSIENYEKIDPNNKLDFSETGKIKMLRNLPDIELEGVMTPQEPELVEEVLLKKVIGWPYDEKGNFLGNQLES